MPGGETITATEESCDLNGFITTVETSESFTTISAPSPGGDLRTYRLSHTDGKFTLVKESWASTPPATYSCDGTTSSEAIESHYSLKDLTTKQRRDWAIWKQNPNDPILNGWDPSTDEDPLIEKLFKWYTAGVTTYLAPRVTVRLIQIEDDPPSLEEVGVIGDPGAPFPYNGNFLCTGVSAQQEGGKWRTSREYLGSQQGSNWDTDLYSGPQ